MKTCVVRRRFYATEADNATVSVELEPNFGTPKGALIFFTESNANTDAYDTSLAYKNFGIGFSDGTNKVCVNITARDNQATTDTQRSHYSTRFVSCVDSTRAVTYYRVDTVTFAQDRIDLAFANSTPQTNGHMEAIIWAIAGDDVSVGVGYSSYNTTTGTSRVYSGLSFQPDFVFTTGILSTLNQTQSADAIISFGAATRSPLKQAGMSFWIDDGVTTKANACRLSATLMNSYISAAATVVSASIGSFSANGWTMTNSGTFAADQVYNFMAIKSASPTDFALLDTFATWTGSGQTFVGLGSTGFVPETIIGTITDATTRDAIQTASGTGTSAFNVFAGTASSYSKLYNGTGTITYSTASSAVTGSGTSFWYFYPGVNLYTPEGLSIGTVSSVTNATSLTLVANASLNGTSQSFTHSNHRQFCMSWIEQDGGTANTETNTLISSKIFTTTATSSTIFEAYLDNSDSRPGVPYRIVKTNSVTKLGWLAAFKSSTLNRRRGTLS